VILYPSSKQSESTRPSPDQVLEDLEERVFKDRLVEPNPPDDAASEETAA
jgi:hypothetical protein